MIPLTLSNFALIGVVVAILFKTDPTLAVFALAPLPLVNFTARRFSSRIHPAVLEVQQEQAQLASVVEETVSGVRVIKGFGAEQVQADKLGTEADDIQRVSLDAARIRAIYLPFIDLLPAAGLIAVLAIGGHRVLNGELTIGELVAFNFYVQLLVWPMRTIGMMVAFGQRAAAALERIDQVLGTTPAVVDPEYPVAPLRRRAGSPAGGSIRFDDVTFGYDPDEPVLDGFSLEIEAGTSVALVGGTGSGKSTVARLLVRFYDPQSGAITLDGVDIRDRPVHDRTPVGRVGVRGHPVVPRHRGRQHRLRRSGGRLRDGSPCRRAGGGGRLHRRPAGGLRHRPGRAWVLAVGWPTPADRDRQGCSSATRACWCSTTRPAPSTRRKNMRSGPRWRP